MTDVKLAEMGWEEVEVEPGNCVQARWRKEIQGLKALITQTKDGIEGVVQAAEQAAHAKKKGEFILKELESPEVAAEVINKLMDALVLTVPQKTVDMPAQV